MAELDALPPKLHDALAAYGQRAGLILQRDSAQVYLDLADNVRAQGVIWTDLHTAVKEYPDLVQEYFMEQAVPVTISPPYLVTSTRITSSVDKAKSAAPLR